MTKKAIELIVKIAAEAVSLVTEILKQRGGGKDNDSKRNSEEK
jgi:hypothetical protein